MEGVITYFNEEKGFGFIEGETMERYFFHKDRISKYFFELDNNGIPNYHKYLYNEYKIDRKDPVYIINFNPLQGKKGLIASNLLATQNLMNTETSSFTIKITDLVFEHFSVSYYDNHPNYGAIARDYTSNVWLNYYKIGGYGKGRVDVRQQILEINERQKITDALINKLKDKIIGMEIKAKRKMTTPIRNDNDVVFYGQTRVHSVHQIILNHQKYEQDLRKESLSFNLNILKI
jgi:hypothetical protein